MKFLAQLFFKATLLPIVWLIYRIRRSGVGFVPREGGALLLSNHVSYIDAFILYLCSPRPVRFVVLEHYAKVGAIGWFLRLFGAIPIRPQNAKEAITRTVDALKEGDLVCLFPEGGLTRVGVTMEFKRGFELIARKADCPVVPVYMDGLWNSVFSFERERYFKKKPNGLTCPLQVSFGRPIPPREAKTETVRCKIWETSIEAFSSRRELEPPLETVLVKALKRRRWKPFLVEYGKKGARSWSRGYTLGLAMAMARRWINNPPEEDDRIGILLPPGPMTVVINYGLFLAGKTPVNLPFTIGEEDMEAVADAIAPLGLRTVITSRAFMSHLADFWQGDEGVFIDMKTVLTGAGSGILLMERIRAFLEPAWMACWRLDLGSRPLSREAVSLVPAPGDEPIFLSSVQLHRNARQVTAAQFVRRGDTLFSEQPLASPAGLILGCWTPALTDGRIVSRSYSLQNNTEILETAIREQEVTLLSGSPALFAGLEDPLPTGSVRHGIFFGKVTLGDLAQWEKIAGIPLARAWSFAGRIATMSCPDPNGESNGRLWNQKGRRPDSVGRFLPGMAAKVVEERLYLRFEPAESLVEATSSDSPENLSAPPGEGKEWIAGPEPAEIEAEGFLLLKKYRPDRKKSAQQGRD